MDPSASGYSHSRQALARAFGLRLGAAMVRRGWNPIPSILMRHFNLIHEGVPISLYTARSWLHGDFLPRPAKLISLAQCLGVPPHELMYGEFYQNPRSSAPAWVLSDREHRLIQCLRQLSTTQYEHIEHLIWLSRTTGHKL